MPTKRKQQGALRARQQPPNSQEHLPGARTTSQALSHATIQRAMESPNTLTTEDVLALQRTVGNVAVQRILARNHRAGSPSGQAPMSQPPMGQPFTGSFTSNLPVQFKMEVGAVDDKYEREANQVARQVLTRLNAPEAHSGASTLQRAPEDDVPGGPTEAGKSPEQDSLIHGGSATPDVERSVLGGSRGGRPLPDAIRSRMESAFNADLSQVRIHTDAKADTLNRSVSALAFTHGTDIYFSKNAFAPGNRAGQGLLAHELAHVVQQGGVQQGSAPQGAVQRQTNSTRRSDLAARLPSADRVARSERALGQAPRIIQRSNAGRIHRCGFSNPFKKKQKPSKKELRRQRGEQLYRSGRIGTLDERFERF